MVFFKTITLAALCCVFSITMAQQWQNFAPGNSPLPFRKISGMAIGSNDRVWFATNSGSGKDTGLAYFDGTGIIPVGPNSGLIYGICAQGDATWFIKSSFLMRLDAAGWTYHTPDPSTGIGQDMLAYSDPIVSDGQHQLWMRPMSGGLLKLANGTWTRYTATNSALPTDIINDLCTTGNTLWIATKNKGLVKQENGIFTTYHTGNSTIPSDTILTICAGNHNDIWMLTKSQQLVRFDGISGFISYALPALYYPTDILMDSASNIWISTMNGLMLFNGVAASMFTTSNSGLSSNEIMCMQLDQHQRLWLGTFSGGVSVYSNRIKTGVAEIIKSTDLLAIYPNPATDQLKVTMVNNEKIIRYIVYDITDRTIEVPCNGNDLDLSAVEHGMYILDVQTENHHIRKQFFRQ